MKMDLYNNREKSYENELENLKNAFFSNIYHEFMTPLNTMLSALQLIDKKSNILEEENSDINIAKDMKIVHKNIFKMMKLCNNIIDITKIKSDTMEFEMLDCDIIQLVENICEDINDYNISNNIKIIFDTNREEHILKIDPIKMERVILNLISNSIKFNKNDEDINIAINISKDFCYIHIKDKGIGISEEKLYNIFDTFLDIENRWNKVSDGIGLGISLSNYIVESHNGSIDVKSKVDEGSEFIVKIPNNNYIDKYNYKIDDNRLKQIKYKLETNRLERIKVELSDIY